MEYIKTPDLTDSSKKAYNDRLRKWIELSGWTIEWLCDHPKEAVAVLQASDKIKHSHRNHHNFISAVVAYLNYEQYGVTHWTAKLKFWRQLQKDNTEPIRQHYLTGKPTALQKDKVMNWNKIIKVRDELPVGKVKFLLGLYTYLNPVRADYFQLTLEHNEKRIPDSQKNYILRDERRNCKMVLQDYKTYKKYGKLEIDMPEPMCRLLDAVIVADKGIHLGNNFLFENERGEPFTRQSFSQWANRQLTKVFKAAYDQPMTLTALRHIFTSQLDSNKPIAELHKIGNSMGHNVAQQRLYKWDDLNGEGKNEVVTPE